VFANLGPGTYKISEETKSGWTKTYDGSTVITAASGADQHGDSGDTEPLNFGNFQIPGPGVRTPGFWTNSKWQQSWNGNPTDQDSLPQNGQPNFPKGEITYSVTDPVTGNHYPLNGKSGLLVGDYNKNGLTDSGEQTLFYSFDEALSILNASQKTQQDARYIL